MFNTLFSALENTRSSISKAFNKLKSGSMSQEEIENIGAIYVKINLSRLGINFIEDFKNCIDLKNMIYRHLHYFLHQ